MKRSISRLLLTLFVLCLAPVLPPGTGEATAGVKDSGSCGDGVEWSLGADGTLTVSGNGAMEDYQGADTDIYPPYALAPWAYEQAGITAVVIGDGVTTIGRHAFGNCENLKRVSIPGSVTAIGNCAFQSCGSLTEVKIPDGVVSIGSSAFGYCYSLTGVSIADSVTFIGVSAFRNCENLKRVSIPGGVTAIEQRTFYACRKLTGVGIPDSVVSIGTSAFNRCGSLTDVYYGGSEEQWARIEIDDYFDGNAELREAAVHYNSALPNGVPAAGLIAAAAVAAALVTVLAAVLKKRRIAP